MMKELKIATSASLVATIETLRQIVRVEQTDYTDVAAVVVSVADVDAGILARLQATGFDIPTFVAVEGDEHLSPDYLPFVSGVFALLAGASKPFYMAQLEAAAGRYVAPQHREATAQRLADELGRLVEEARPGSDLQLQLATAWAAAARGESGVARLRALADGSQRLEGLEVDTDMRWVLMTGLAKNGALSAAELEAEGARDRTASGAERLARARAARPDAQSKQQAWDTVWGGSSLPNAEVVATAAGWQRVQDPEDLRRFVGPYFDRVAAMWDDRTHAIAEAVAGGFLAAGDDDVLGSAHDALRCEVDGLLAGPALPVDGGAGHLERETGCEPGGPGDVARLATDGVEAAEHHGVDGSRVEPGALDEGGDDVGAEVGGVGLGQRAVPLADRGADGVERRSNRAGGLEGGMTNGEDLRVRIAMKPISTVPRALSTIDMSTGETASAIHQRSDVCAVPAAGVVAEAMVALVVAQAALEKFGGDSVTETGANLAAYRAAVDARPPRA